MGCYRLSFQLTREWAHSHYSQLTPCVAQEQWARQSSWATEPVAPSSWAQGFPVPASASSNVVLWDIVSTSGPDAAPCVRRKGNRIASVADRKYTAAVTFRDGSSRLKPVSRNSTKFLADIEGGASRYGRVVLRGEPCSVGGVMLLGEPHPHCGRVVLTGESHTVGGWR